MCGMRLDHGPQRKLLQVPELRLYERLQLGLTRLNGETQSAAGWVSSILGFRR